MIVYVTVGNSDNKLTQAAWADLQREVVRILTTYNARFHGKWHSNPVSRFQNACACAYVHDDDMTDLRADLADLAQRYTQESIVLAAVPRVEFIKPSVSDASNVMRDVDVVLAD